MKRSPDQQALPFDAAYRERFALVDAIDWQRSGLSRVRWRRVADLVKAIHACSDRSDAEAWCDAWVATLADRCGCDERTFRRTRQTAEELGLVEVERTYDHRGQGKSRWRVRWEHLARLGVDAARPGAGQNAGGAGQNAGGAGQNVRAYKRNSSSSNSPVNSMVDSARVRPIATESVAPRSESSRVESTRKKVGGRAPGTNAPGSASRAAEQCAIDWDRVAGMAREVVRRISGAKLPTSRDWELAVKASCLAATYGERWLWSAVNGARVKARRRPWGYLWVTLLDEATRLGRPFRRDLAKITIPPWVALAQPGEVREPRMCAARDADDEFDP